MESRRFILFVFALSLSFFVINHYFFPQKVEQKRETLVQKQTIQQEAHPPSILPVQSESESYYVLENETIQLVFSNLGGSIVGINLPFTNTSHQSIVRPIEIDQEVKQYAPQTDYFPLKGSHYLPGMKSSDEQQLGGYYPLIRRDAPYQYRCMNIYSERNDPSHISYKVTDFNRNTITFVGTQSNRTITKTFTIDPNIPYLFTVHVQVDGDTSGLYLTSGVLETELSSGSPTNILKYRQLVGGKSQTTVLSLPKETVTYSSLGYDWVSNSNGYFGLIIDPINRLETGLKAQYVDGKTVPSRVTYINTPSGDYPAEKYPGYQLLVPLQSPVEFRIFAGPYQQSLLASIDKQFPNENLDFVEAKTFQGWFTTIAKPFSKLLFVILELCYSFTHSWGISIILLTVFLRLLLWPLNSWTMKSQAKMQEINPQVKAIQEKYKKDALKMHTEMRKLYRETGANPALGCLPALIQIPFMIGIFDLLRSTYELRGVSFISGWIDNLSAPDTLFCWGYHIPFLGSCFHLLPFLVAGVTFWQQRMSSNLPKNVADWTDQQRQQRVMNNVMIPMFLLICYSFPSGMNIYWIFNSLLAILQQWFSSGRQAKKAVES